MVIALLRFPNRRNRGQDGVPDGSPLTSRGRIIGVIRHATRGADQGSCPAACPRRRDRDGTPPTWGNLAPNLGPPVPWSQGALASAVLRLLRKSTSAGEARLVRRPYHWLGSLGRGRRADSPALDDGRSVAPAAQPRPPAEVDEADSCRYAWPNRVYVT